MQMAMTLVPTNAIVSTAREAETHVREGRRKVTIAQTIFGRILDFAGDMVLTPLNAKLERDVLLVLGLAKQVSDLDPSRVIDGSMQLRAKLTGLARHAADLHALATKAKNNVHLTLTNAGLCQLAEFTGALRQAVEDLKVAIARHDMRAIQSSEDMLRVIADLKSRDDVPAGHYAELVSVLKRAPALPPEDRRGDPDPL